VSAPHAFCTSSADIASTICCSSSSQAPLSPVGNRLSLPAR